MKRLFIFFATIFLINNFSSCKKSDLTSTSIASTFLNDYHGVDMHKHKWSMEYPDSLLESINIKSDIYFEKEGADLRFKCNTEDLNLLFKDDTAGNNQNEIVLEAIDPSITVGYNRAYLHLNTLTDSVFIDFQRGYHSHYTFWQFKFKR